MRRIVLNQVAAAIVLVGAVFSLPVMAGPLSLGILANYGLVALGNGKTIGQNSGPMTGNELLGNGITAAFAGGGGGQITGALSYDSTVLGTNTFSQLATAPTTQLVTASVTNMALNQAQALSNYAASLTATQTYGNISSATTITGNGGLNVINVSNIQNAPLTIVGTSNDTFVFDISGSFNTNQTMTLSGVSASQILFNFTATSGNVFQTSGGNNLYGTFLATNGGNFQFSNLVLNGELINTAGNVQFVSGSRTTANTPFVSPGDSVGAAPEPASLVLFGAGLSGLAFLRRRKRG